MNARKPPGVDGTDPFVDNPAGAITVAVAKRVAAWISEAAPLVGLQGWRHYVSTHECTEDATASNQIREGSEEQWIAVERGFQKVDERRRRATITHELLHAHMGSTYNPLVSLLEDYMPPPAFDTAKQLVHDREERMIERLAWAISERLPEMTL